jgi:hypothetical protein
MSVTLSSLQVKVQSISDSYRSGRIFDLARIASYGQDSAAEEVWVSSEIATSVPRETQREGVERRPWRALAVQLLGPITIVGGLVWGVAQPYRILILDRDSRGGDLYDYVFQGPLLVILVGLAFAVLVAPGLVADLEAEERRDSAG